MSQSHPGDWICVGFAGTSRGMTKPQRRRVKKILELASASLGANHFIHGGDQGAEEEAARIASGLGYVLVERPSDEPNGSHVHSTEVTSHIVHPARPPLERYASILGDADILLAAPHTMTPAPRSRTWAEVLAARRAGVPEIVVFPDGTFKISEPVSHPLLAPLLAKKVRG